MGIACEIVLYGGPLSRRTVSVDTDDSVYRGELDRKTCLYAVDWDSRRGMYIGDTAPSVTTELDRLRASVSTLCDAMESMLPLIRLLTVRQVIQAGDDVINAVGLNPWCISEGLATGDEFVSVSKFERAIREARGE